MFNISKLDTHAYMSIRRDAYGMSRGFDECDEVYPSGDGHDECVFMHRKRIDYKVRNLCHWIIKYDVRHNKQLWACKVDKKQKMRLTSDGGLELEDGNIKGPYTWDDTYIFQINTDFLIEKYSGKLCLRSSHDGRVVVKSPLGNVALKSLLLSQDGHLLLWNHSGELECYQNMKLRWKRPLQSKPTNCRYHSKAGYVFFYEDRKQVYICRPDNGHISSIPIMIQAGGWCDTDDGFMLSIVSALYHLDVSNGKSRMIATLPAGHQFVAMKRTNRNYYVVMTTCGSELDEKFYYSVYNVKSGKLMKTLLCRQNLPYLNVVGIGEDMVVLPRLPQHPSLINNRLCIYDIDHDKRHYNFDPYEGSYVQSYGKTRLLVNDGNDIMVYG